MIIAQPPDNREAELSGRLTRGALAFAMTIHDGALCSDPKNLADEILTLGLTPRLMKPEERFVSAAGGRRCWAESSV
jgi:hypothetical protein